jgi:Domain of unknown function (DUF4382)/Domain of unknown function (DUF5666)
MSSELHSSSKGQCLLAFFSLSVATLLAAGCGGVQGNAAADSASGATGPAFIVGTDAPMASVVAFNVQINSINAVTTGGTSVPLLSGTPTVDFARFNGLQTLLDMNDVPAGTYNSIVITLGPATLGYLNTSANAAPTIQTETATLTQSTTTIALASPLVVTTTAPVGLHLDFNLRKSIQVDGNGQITGAVTPTFAVNAVGPGDAGAYIDEFDAAVVSVNTTAQSFVIQGPHGRQFTVNVNGSTEWDNNDTLSSLTSSSIVQVSGVLDRADATLDADEVAVLSQNGFYAHGQVTYVQPPSGAATDFDLYVRGLLPTTTGLTLGQIAQVNLTGQEKYLIYWMHNPLSEFLFNPSTMLAGQSVSIGGPATGAANAQAVTANRAVLRHWGFNGTVVANSVNTANNTFQMQINGFAGVLVPQTVTVYLGAGTSFRDGMTGMSTVQAGANVRVVGLLLKDPTSGLPVLLGRYVDALN